MAPRECFRIPEVQVKMASAALAGGHCRRDWHVACAAASLGEGGVGAVAERERVAVQDEHVEVPVRAAVAAELLHVHCRAEILQCFPSVF